MRIVYIANEINGTTGLERMISVQVNYFVRNFQYDVNLILIEQKKENIKNTFFEIDDSIDFHYMQSKKGPKKDYFKLINSLNQALTRLKPDIVMVCIDDMVWLYLPYFLKKEYKIIYQRHSTKDINLNRYYKDFKTKVSNLIKSKIILFGGRCYDAFVILTNEHKQDWKYVKNLAVIGNPLVLETEGLQASVNKKVVLAVGRHDPVKGFDMLLRSWSEVVNKFPDWKLRIVGKKTTVIDLKSEAQNLKIESNVQFIEYTKEITKEYINASILVCSSLMEGFSLAIVEAMSLGVPAVSFDCPYGPRAIINHGEDGLLVKPNDTEELAEALIRLIEDESLRKQMGEKAQVNIQRYAPDKIMQQWKSLFESLIQ